MKYIATKMILHDRLGRIEKGQVFEIDSLSGIGHLVRPYDTKIVEEEPKKKPLDIEPRSALPPAQALPEPTVIESKRGRKPKREG